MTWPTLDEGGDAVLADSVEDALGDADAQTAESGISTMSLDDAVSSITSGARSGNVVVVLDPGHDNSHGGTSGTTNGVSYKEQDYNLKIAQYCKAALETVCRHHGLYDPRVQHLPLWRQFGVLH